MTTDTQRKRFETRLNGGTFPQIAEVAEYESIGDTLTGCASLTVSTHEDGTAYVAANRYWNMDKDTRSAGSVNITIPTWADAEAFALKILQAVAEARAKKAVA